MIFEQTICYQTKNFTVRLAELSDTYEIVYEKGTHGVVIARRTTGNQAIERADQFQKAYDERPQDFKNF